MFDTISITFALNMKLHTPAFLIITPTNYNPNNSQSNTDPVANYSDSFITMAVISFP